jgi:hypothetical protein
MHYLFKLFDYEGGAQFLFVVADYQGIADQS